jgi:peptide/nickel transport system permease protein
MAITLPGPAGPLGSPGPATADTVPVVRESGRGALRAFVRRPGAMLALVVLLVIVAGAVFAPLLAPHDPNAQNPVYQLIPPAWAHGGNSSYLFGTDELGRDLFSRMLYGARSALALAFLAATISAVVGTLAGLIAGMIPRGVGSVIMWICDSQLAFPFVVLALVVITVRGSGFGSLLFVLTVFGWVQYARVVRAEVLRVKQADYVLAARGSGGSTAVIIRRHLLPNVISPVVVLWTFSVAAVLLLESALSFLGLGVQPPKSDWGQMFAAGRAYLLQDWWYCFFPGAGITLTVLCANVVGRAVRDVLNPRLR